MRGMTQKPVYLSAPLALAKDDGLPSQFDGIAYSGGLVPNYEPIVIDLTSLRAQAPMPLLYEHTRELAIGTVASTVNTGDALTVTGSLFSGFDATAESVAQKAAAGMPWQMSVGVFDFSVESVPAGKSISVNGRDFAGPVAVLRGAHVREVSVVALGADPDTAVSMFSQPEGVPPMSESNPARVAELEAELASVKAELATHAAASAAREAEAQSAALSVLLKLLGKPAGAAAPYATMTAAQLTALTDDLRAAAPAALFHEQSASTGQPAASILLADARARYAA